MRKVRSFGWVAALAISWGAAAQPAGTASGSGPPLWVMRNGDAVAYLFGRMAVTKETQWLTPPIEAALAASDVLWLENPRGDGDRGNELIGRLGFAEDYSVLDAIGDADRARVILLLERAGMTADALDGRRAWLANLFLSQLIDRTNGIDGAWFPDAVLRQRAELKGMAVRTEWRDLAELVEYSVGLEEKVQLQMLGKALDDAESYSARLTAWSSGDLDALAKSADATAAAYPDAHREVNVERNERWAERIRAMLADDDTELVALGIGHLVGPDNLLDQLRAAGIEVERVN